MQSNSLSQERPTLSRDVGLNNTHKRGIFITSIVLGIMFLSMGITAFAMRDFGGIVYFVYFCMGTVCLAPTIFVLCKACKRHNNSMHQYRNRDEPLQGRPRVPVQTGPRDFVYPVAFSEASSRNAPHMNLIGVPSTYSPNPPTAPNPNVAVVPPSSSHIDTPPPSYDECVSGMASSIQHAQGQATESHHMMGDYRPYSPLPPPPFNPLFFPHGESAQGSLSYHTPTRLATAPLLSPEDMSPGRMSPGRVPSGRISPGRASPDRRSQGRSSPHRLSPNSPSTEYTNYGPI